MKEDELKDKLQEPETTYESKRIRFFSSFEEAEEDNYRYWLSLTPELRIANVTTLIKKIYADELKGQKKDKRIHFKG